MSILQNNNKEIDIDIEKSIDNILKLSSKVEEFKFQINYMQCNEDKINYKINFINSKNSISCKIIQLVITISKKNIK